MIAKEKAEKIVDNLMWCCTTSDQTAPLCENTAKQCALICVDEILNLDFFSLEGREYWNEVRKELELL